MHSGPDGPDQTGSIFVYIHLYMINIFNSVNLCNMNIKVYLNKYSKYIP